MIFAGFKSDPRLLGSLPAQEKAIWTPLYEGLKKGEASALSALTDAVAKAEGLALTVIDGTGKGKAPYGEVPRKQVGVGFFVIDDVLLLQKEKDFLGVKNYNVNMWVVATFHMFNLNDGTIRYSASFVWPFQLDTVNKDWHSEMVAWIKSDELTKLLPQYFGRTAELLTTGAGFRSVFRDAMADAGQTDSRLSSTTFSKSYVRVDTKLEIKGGRFNDAHLLGRIESVADALLTQHTARHLLTVPSYVKSDATPLEKRDPREQQIRAILLDDDKDKWTIKRSIEELTGYDLQDDPERSGRQITFRSSGGNKYAYLGINLFPNATRTLQARITTERKPKGAPDGGEDQVIGTFRFALLDALGRDICAADGKPAPARTEMVEDSYVHVPGIDRGVIDDFIVIWRMARGLSKAPLFADQGLFGPDSKILEREEGGVTCKS